MQKTCMNCGIEFEAKRSSAKFHNDKCKLEYNRNLKNPTNVARKGGEEKPRELKGLTTTDAVFEEERPSYYIYDKELLTKKCVRCGKEFETHLRLLKFCTPICKSEIMVLIANVNK